MQHKGIVLAGGSGTRLYPLTRPIVKQLLPIYDKPMVYYPLSVLMLAGIRDIIIISTPQDLGHFEKLFEDGSALGLTIQYIIQKQPEGIAQAFLLTEHVIKDCATTLILGDNIFFGSDLSTSLNNAFENKDHATIFATKVKDPRQYGVVHFNAQGHATKLVEKPNHPESNFAITGLYFYPPDVVEQTKKLTPSARGELEITDLNMLYLNEKRLTVECFKRGMAWLDTGTHNTLLEAGLFVKTIEERHGVKIACLEEIAYRKGYITAEQLETLAKPLYKTEYGQYLLESIKE
ncbi:MAG: glucose-1-phosphate thymidylyltransferase RfbA [Desulfovibrionaceae bacterium]